MNKDTKQIIYKSGYKYQLVTHCTYKTGIKIKEAIFTEFINLYPDGYLYIKASYAWDGPSGTTIDTPTFMRGSLIHDALYQLGRTGYLDIKWRKQADIELKKICLEDGMQKWRAAYVYWCVRKFAKFAWLPKNKKQLMVAPKWQTKQKH